MPSKLFVWCFSVSRIHTKCILKQKICWIRTIAFVFKYLKFHWERISITWTRFFYFLLVFSFSLNHNTKLWFLPFRVCNLSYFRKLPILNQFWSKSKDLSSPFIREVVKIGCFTTRVSKYIFYYNQNQNISISNVGIKKQLTVWGDGKGGGW